jgi:hypothetical protein
MCGASLQLQSVLERVSGFHSRRQLFANAAIAASRVQRKRNRKAVHDDRWNAVPLSNYRRLDEWRGLITANCRRKRTAVEL